MKAQMQRKRKIAVIGAGSITFTRRLMHDILSIPELQETEFALMDISESILGMMATLMRRDVEANGLATKITTTTDRREAMRGADYVMCLIRQGGLEAFKTDIEIPLKYGVDQCVGDTLCAGGIMYAQRTIHELLDICRDIREVAAPNALFINYSNPMAMNTWACNQYGGVRTIGLCHGVQGGHRQITNCIELWARAQGMIGPEEKIEQKEVNIIASGINHQTWYIHAEWRGIDFIPKMLSLFESHPDYVKTEKVRIDVLRRFGFYSTESNGHLSEYLPWYRKHTDQICRWIDLSDWIHGETGGYLRICTEERDWFKADFPNWMSQPAWDLKTYTRSEEHAGWIIEALETGRVYRGHFNTPNRGYIPNLPEGCIVEIPGYVDKTGIHFPVVGDLPLACAATCAASVRVQQMGVEAAVHGDVTLLKQAMLHDPLVGAVCDPEAVWQMTDEMLVAQAAWLPQYTAAIQPARERLAEHEARGTRVALRETQGVARLATKTVAQMAEEKAAKSKKG